tara:strand:- start:4973 stop:5587 length:615 start_codon:yes stop_codon:yes gene_type:complete
VSNNFLIPTSYLAPIGYYALLLKKNCTIENYEYFVKHSIRNRCEIYGANGKLILTVPKIRKASSKTTINKIKISNSENWRKIHWNAIKSCYNSSPFFQYYKNELKEIYNFEEELLINFNNKLQKVILNFLKIKTTYTFSSNFKKKGDFFDLRDYKFNINNMKEYNQVFMEKHGFIDNLSIIDLLFNLGPESKDYLTSLNNKVTK